MNAFCTFSALSRAALGVSRTRCRSYAWLAASLCVALGGALQPALAADSAAIKPTAKTAPKASSTPATKPKAGAPKKAAVVDAPPAEASDEQRSAAERVYYGEYHCEFKQVVNISASERNPSYVDLRFAKSSYLMKPVLSSTGAIRLEDVKGQTLMVQIASKSMLLNVKTGTRVVDECIGARHLAEIEAAKRSAAAEVAEGATGTTTSAAIKPVP